MTAPKLKPCPCGGNPVHSQFGAGDGKQIAAQITCDRCMAHSDLLKNRSTRQLERFVVRNWNRSVDHWAKYDVRFPARSAPLPAPVSAGSAQRHGGMT